MLHRIRTSHIEKILKLDREALLITDPLPTSITTLSKKNHIEKN